MDRNIQAIQEKLKDRGEAARLLMVTGDEQKQLHQMARSVRSQKLGDIVYFRGLIEFSNVCAKDCLYCGIRRSNKEVSRYTLDDQTIVDAACYAADQRYGSIVLQAGELTSNAFTWRIGKLLDKIHKATQNTLRITLSLGEQPEEVYRYWKDRGAHRYLLRIETSDTGLYRKIHPDNPLHEHQRRLDALQTLKSLGYQTGTGVMIGLPGQTAQDLVSDLRFMSEFNIDMVGMGPYIEHRNTPLYSERHKLWPREKRFGVTLNMIALLRLMMPDINIAAATALQAIDKVGREKAIRCGANIIMPNITPGVFRGNYKLYEDKPCTDENADDCLNCLQVRVGMTGSRIGLGEWGDSAHFHARNTGSAAATQSRLS